MANGWKTDQAGKIEIFRIPKGVCLESTGSRKANLDTIPYDILLIIFDNIDLSDRLCLGLTCKHLAYHVTCSPRIPFICKIQAGYFLPYNLVNGLHQPGQHRPLYISFTPEWYTLIPRLAKGWVPKDKFKYCWKCNRILPSDKSYFEKVLSKSKPLGWLRKLDLTEAQWGRLKPGERREHIVARWLNDYSTLHESMRPRHNVSKVYYPELGLWADRKPDERGFECPLCLERELIHAHQWPKGLFEYSVSTSIFLMNLARLPVDFGVSAINTTSRWIRFPC